MSLRRIALVGVALMLAACSNCDAPCRGGITFYVAELAGALSRGGNEALTICIDGDCQDVTITRDNVGGSVFRPFTGIGSNGDHDLTLTGTGSLKGEYKGAIFSYVQDPGGDCKTCALATVKIGADGTLTPGITPPPATTAGGVASTTIAAAPWSPSRHTTTPLSSRLVVGG